MILEELFGSCVALVSRLIIQTPPISRENLQREYTLISVPNREQDEVYDGLIHREYEQEVPFYEDGTFVRMQADPTRNFCESLIRSLKANVGLITAVVFVLGSLTVGVVYVDLNSNDACIEWMHKNVSIPAHVRTLRIVGMSVKLLPLFSCFPACIALLWGFREFKKNYLTRLFFCAFVPGSITCVYRIIMFDKFTNVDYNLYRLPSNLLFMFSIVCGAYSVARKFKKVNPATSYSVFRIIFILSSAFLGACLFSFIYTFIIIKYFRKTEGKIKKAIIAALTPGIVFPLTAFVKYIILRKSSEIITPDRAFVLCYFLRGATIVLYRTMQSGFQDIWLFVGLSLLHGISNVLSKATLNVRIKLWRFFIKYINRICCGPRLEVQPLNSPRIRRFNADLEIQNILFEYATVILSQAYLACYLVMSYDVPSWQVIRASLIRVAISLAIDFAFNIVSLFIQIHFYDIPIQKIWTKYWGRHVFANAFMIIVFVAYFGSVLVRVFADNNNTLEEHKLKNCTTLF
ncbi:Hypothetical predicted protein [Paramuricea clavata]|uniref:Uncharacterized protein n=1 Tax=Paramuricea clavata TaxID=317549 RepID=A0A6S7J666_PARCT|nr:Hypothetical predicted protein [Paramuricea clavata]